MEYINIGRTGKPHGTKGELRLYTEAPLIPFIEQVPAVFFEEKGKYIPYFLQQVRSGEIALLRLEEIDSRSAAQALVGRDVFAREKDLNLPDGLLDTVSNLEYVHLKGYTVIDLEQGNLGLIQSVEAYPQQEMARVKHQEREWLLPLTAAFIQSENPDAKILRVLLPQGLADI